MRVGQVVAVVAGIAGRGVAGERYAGAGVPRQVAEHHRLHIHGGTEVIGNPLLASVQLRPLGVPGVEHRPNRHRQLFTGVLREWLTAVFGNQREVLLAQLFQVIPGQLDVELNPSSLLGLIETGGELIPCHSQDCFPEHGQQPPVGVPGESRIIGEASQSG